MVSVYLLSSQGVYDHFEFRREHQCSIEEQLMPAIFGLK
jgi:hypothetical protein